MEEKTINCRICDSSNLVNFLNLGDQAFTGYFPSSASEVESYGEIELARCSECGLVQMNASYPLEEMYGDNYGYRSGLNQSMVQHLGRSVEAALKIAKLEPEDFVIDIGSNDCTLLKFYPSDLNLALLGVDPTGKKFKEYYPDHIDLIEDFFPCKELDRRYGERKAKIITSFSCFYDLEDPVAFVKDISSRLHSEGIWVFEQSYLPAMLKAMSYDTACHEHLEYYALKQVKYILDKCDLKIVDVTFNDVNGGSFCVVAARSESKYKEATTLVESILRDEKEFGLEDINFYLDFSKKVAIHREELLELLNQLKRNGQRVVAIGASTKGNVLLQYCGIDSNLVSCVGEVNPYKFGRFTPGTKISICSEGDVDKIKPDYKLVLPWHFRDFFIQREQKFIKEGGKLIFPLPRLEVYPA